MKRSVMSLSLFAGVVLGCGGGHSAVDSQYPATAQLASLSVAQREELCREYRRELSSAGAFDDLCQILVYALNLVGEGTAQQCRDGVSSCMADSFDPDDPVCDFVSADVSSCSVTVGEIDACYQDLIPYLSETAAKYSCDLVGTTGAPTPSAAESGSSTPAIASCESAKKKCPALFRDTSSSKKGSTANSKFGVL